MKAMRRLSDRVMLPTVGGTCTVSAHLSNMSIPLTRPAAGTYESVPRVPVWLEIRGLTRELVDSQSGH